MLLSYYAQQQLEYKSYIKWGFYCVITLTLMHILETVNDLAGSLDITVNESS